MPLYIELKNHRGFSLIEVLITVVLLMMIFLILMNFYLSSIAYEQESEMEIGALNLAQEKMDEILLGGYDGLSDVAGLFNDYNNSGYELEIRVSSSGSSVPYLREVRVIVKWEQKGQIRSTELATLLNKN
jgi:type II secretory pathway pseudopilin PulG